MVIFNLNTGTLANKIVKDGLLASRTTNIVDQSLKRRVRTLTTKRTVATPSTSKRSLKAGSTSAAAAATPAAAAGLRFASSLGGVSGTDSPSP
jgi:hypothetical protein